MNSEQRTAFQARYQAGLAAFEGGQYRQSIIELEQACQLSNRASRVGGEAQLWLVSAYQAADRLEAAIALCQTLQHHPQPSISRKAKDLLYILRAPRLQRPPEWLSKIPDLANLDDSAEQQRYVSAAAPTAPAEPELSLAQFATTTGDGSSDNQAFVGLAIAVAVLVLGGLWWLA
ncbi:MAG: hypothetical protein HC838_17590 [Spirulinaceae cyanobacterium RM2_2_10]|nr:hypothetical protein [Spirulinaceae cyanobacterium SM2_1_0]NJO21486.1 hypothetical protein [Spirulinaceae cyanobacterium RM2_2_10]